MSTEQTLRSYILENYLFSDDPSELNNGDSFLDQGILDSTGIMELIFFIEEHYGLSVEDEEMVPENLDSIDNLVRFIAGKKNAA
jgi:acyl carrier protein